MLLSLFLHTICADIFGKSFHRLKNSLCREPEGSLTDQLLRRKRFSNVIATKVSFIKKIEQQDKNGAIDIIETVISGFKAASYRLNIANILFNVIDFYRQTHLNS